MEVRSVGWSPQMVTVSSFYSGQSGTVVCKTTLTVIIGWILQKYQDELDFFVAETSCLRTIIFLHQTEKDRRMQRKCYAPDDYVNEYSHFDSCSNASVVCACCCMMSPKPHKDVYKLYL